VREPGSHFAPLTQAALATHGEPESGTRLTAAQRHGTASRDRPYSAVAGQEARVDCQIDWQLPHSTPPGVSGRRARSHKFDNISVAVASMSVTQTGWIPRIYL
jgi:hypothetical protein